MNGVTVRWVFGLQVISGKASVGAVVSPDTPRKNMHKKKS